MFEGQSDLPISVPKDDSLQKDDSFEVDINTTDMDITSCVGGIISLVSSPLPPNENIDFISMDETQCVGGIVQEFTEQSSSMEITATDMELTCTVGGILHDPLEQSSVSLISDSMDITSCVGEVIFMKHQTEVLELDLNMKQTPLEEDKNEQNQHAQEAQPKGNLKDLFEEPANVPLGHLFGEQDAPSSTTCHVDEFNNLFLPRLSLKSSLDATISQSQTSSHVNTPTKSVIWKICSPITGRKMSMGMVFSPISSTHTFTSTEETNGKTTGAELALLSTPNKLIPQSASVSSPISVLSSFPLQGEQALRVSNVPMTGYSPYVEKLKEDISKVKDSPLVIGTPKWRSMASPLRNRLVELRASPISNTIFSSPMRRLSSLLPSVMEGQDVSFIEDMVQPQLVDISHSPVLRALKKSKFEANDEGQAKDNIDKAPNDRAVNIEKMEPKQVIDLRRFLTDAGIRFLDNVTSNTTRRETLSRSSRDSGDFSAKRLVLHWCISMPECELYEQSCEVLELRVADIRAELQQIESRFQSDPPGIYTLFYAHPPSSSNHEELRAQMIVRMVRSTNE